MRVFIEGNCTNAGHLFSELMRQFAFELFGGCVAYVSSDIKGTLAAKLFSHLRDEGPFLICSTFRLAVHMGAGTVYP